MYSKYIGILTQYKKNENISKAFEECFLIEKVIGISRVSGRFGVTLHTRQQNSNQCSRKEWIYFWNQDSRLLLQNIEYSVCNILMPNFLFLHFTLHRHRNCQLVELKAAQGKHKPASVLPLTQSSRQTF